LSSADPAARLEYSENSTRAAEVEHLLSVAASDLDLVFKHPEALSVRVSILPAEQLTAIVGAPDWATGIFHQGHILIPATKHALSPDTLRKTIRHEYLHAIVASLSGSRCPAWLDEGLAQLFEGKELEQTDIQELRALANTDSMPMLRDLTAGFTSFSRSEALAAYRFSLFATSYLLRSASPEQVKQFLLSLSGTVPTDEAFAEAFGRSFDSFERALLATLGRKTINFIP
jgi:hypothetical protein